MLVNIILSGDKTDLENMHLSSSVVCIMDDPTFILTDQVHIIISLHIPYTGTSERVN